MYDEYGRAPSQPFKILDWDELSKIEHRMRMKFTPEQQALMDRYFPSPHDVRRQISSIGSSGSTSGSVNIKPSPAKGEEWYVKVPGQDRLELVEIILITGAMVEVQSITNPLSIRNGCYERDFFKFVEKHVSSLEPKPV